MIKIDDQQKLKYYIEKYDIDNIFESNMKDYMELHLFSKDEHICRSNERITYFYFLVDGRAKAYTLLSNGKSLLLRFYNPLQVIGDIEFLELDTAADCNMAAVKECLCIGISLDNIRKYASNDSTFLKYICKSLGKKLSNHSTSSSINLLYPLENRLASYILAITPEQDGCPLDGIITDNLIEIAELLGASYRHLIRVLNKFYENKLIKKDNNLLIILDRKSLQELAGDLYE